MASSFYVPHHNSYPSKLFFCTLNTNPKRRLYGGGTPLILNFTQGGSKRLVSETGFNRFNKRTFWCPFYGRLGKGVKILMKRKISCQAGIKSLSTGS